MLAPRGWADLQVGGEVVAAFVFRKIGLARGVPACEARVADPLGRQDLLAVIVLRLGNEDVFEGLCPLLGFDLLLWSRLQARPPASSLALGSGKAGRRPSTCLM